jgi:type IV pilus assembly protein PilA
VVKRVGHKSGFTLVEVLVTCALLGILATLAVSQFAAYRQKGYNSAAISDLGNFKIALEAYFAENKHYP